MEPDERDCQDLNNGDTNYAYLNQFGDLENRALISICDVAFRFPSLGQIADVDKAGPGCNGLGPYDSGWMTPLGGLVLHELFHWRYLLRDVQGFDDIVQELEGEKDENIIVDYDGKLSSSLPISYSLTNLISRGGLDAFRTDKWLRSISFPSTG